MRDSESTEDIYNSLPIDLFTNDLDDYESDSLGSELDNYSSELEPTHELMTTNDLNSKVHNSTASASPEIIADDIDRVSSSLSQLELNPKKVEKTINEVSSPINKSSHDNDESSTMWIRCVRCGKKNEIDCNFCGKCGLQIHKTILIVEPEAEEQLTPEVSRNIKYHYKRPVFCFGPKGNCFASFSSPSKSVRNVAKFQLSTLNEFKDKVIALKKDKILASNLPLTWREAELKDTDWIQKESIMKDITIMVANKASFALDDSLKDNLREYFANISPKDLGSIKMLATQDNVSYLRNEIDQVFHLLVIGKTMEACEMAIRFNYWDHALIIAKTLEVSFYEEVMNRFLDSRFSNGHPLRILYLIMTSNEKSALEEIRNMIKNEEMPMFVQEIWTILVNFLLRAKHESLVISKIFEDIAKCLFDRSLFENSLVCYIISVLSGSNSLNSDVIEKIDYLLSWFCRKPAIDTINFAAIHILNVFVDKIDSLKSGGIMWRAQFVRLIYTQFLHDIGQFDETSLNRLGTAVEFSKKTTNAGIPSLLIEEFSVLEARNMSRTGKKKSNPEVNSSITENYSNRLVDSSNLSKKSSPNLAYEHASTSMRSPIHLNTEDYVPISSNFETATQTSSYSPTSNDDLISNNLPISSPINSPSHDNLSKEMINSPQHTKSESGQHQSNQEKSDSGGNVFGKLKSWFPAGKLGSASSQDNQKQITKAKMGKPNTFRYDEKLKKWVDDSDPSTFEQAPKLPPPPTAVGASTLPSSNSQAPTADGAVNFRAKKGKVKYFDPLNPDAPNSAVLQPSMPNFD